MGKEFTIAVVFAVVLAVLAIFGVVYGVRCQPKPAPMLDVCWGLAGQASYVEGQSEVHQKTQCPSPVPLRWAPSAGRPLRLFVHGENARLATHDENDAVNAAVRALNSQVGCEVLRRVNMPAPIAVVLGVAAMHDDAVADCHHIGRDGLATQAHVRVRNVASTSALASIVAHELGHALGLAHVPDNSALMRPFQPDVLLPRLPTLYLSDAHLVALRNEFCTAQ